MNKSTSHTWSANRTNSLIGILLPLPACIAIGASLWPFERVALIFLCGVLCLVLSFCAMLTAFAGSRRGLLASLAMLVVVLSVATANWPLRAAYGMSRPAFEQLAGEVRAGKTVDAPRRVGAFTVQRAEVNRRGVVCLWTDLTPSGYTGFVQCGPENPPFNLWSHLALDDSWQFISED